MPKWRILERLKASPTNLMGPDFDDAPWYEMDLSGTKIRLKRPLTDILAPYERLPKKWNIYDADIYEHTEGSTLNCQKIFDTGWGFWQGYFAREPQMGCVLLQVNIDERINKPTDLKESFFNQTYYQKWLQNDIKTRWDFYNHHDIWEKRHDFIEEVVPELDYTRYPESVDQIELEEYNGHTWFCYNIFKLGKPSERYCTLPISDHHQISISFDPVSYDYSYFDPATNIREATEKSRITFMQNLHIELSRDAKAQQKAVLNALKQPESID